MKNRLSEKIFEMRIASDKFLETYPLAHKYDWKTPAIRGLLFVYPPQVKFNGSEQRDPSVANRHSLEALDPTEFSEPALDNARSLFRSYYARNIKAGDRSDQTHA